MPQTDIILKVNHNVTHIEGSLDGEIYSRLKKELGYRPENVDWMIKKLSETKRWMKDWDGVISNLCRYKCKCYIKKRGTHFSTGLLGKTKAFFEKEGVTYRAIDIRKKEGESVHYEMNTDEFELRDYQEEVIKKAVQQQRGIIRAATGSGKCVDKDSLVFTSCGMLTLKQLAPSHLLPGDYSSLKTNVINDDNIDKTSHIYYDGYKESIKITTGAGFELSGTLNHRILVLDNNSQLQWKRLKDVFEHDIIPICRGTNLFGTYEDITEDDAYLLGLLIGDGCLTGRIIKLYNEQKEVIDFIYQYCKKNKIKFRIYSDKKSKNLKRIEFLVAFSDFLRRKYGLCNKLSIHKTIPLAILRAKKEFVAAFIRGLFVTDGFCTSDSISIGLSNEKIIRDLQVILLNFDIISHRRRKKTPRHDNFILTAYGENISEFVKVFSVDLSMKKFHHIRDRLTKSIVSNTNVNLLYKTKEAMKLCLEKFQLDYKTDNKSEYQVKFKQTFNVRYNSYCRVIRGDRGLTKCLFDTVNSILPESQISCPVDKEDIEMLLISARKKFKDQIVKKMTMSQYCINQLEIPIKTFRSYTVTRNPDLNKAHEIFLRYGTIEQQSLTDGRYFFDTVKRVKSRLSKNYDLVVPKSNKFIAQGFINHNTAIGAGIIATLGKVPFVFYVTSKDLLEQAYNEIRRFVNYNGVSLNVGRVGDGHKDIQDVTVMTVQTAVRALGAKYEKFDDEDKDKDDTDIEDIKRDIKDLITGARGMIADETQHWASATCQIISDASESCQYRYGMSGTPHRDLGDDILIDACFGKYIADISASFLIRKGYLVKPEIFFVPIKNMRGFPKTSYPEIYKHAIVENSLRNTYIANIAQTMRDNGKIILILCRQIAHGKLLNSMIPDSMFLHGSHSAKKRKAHLDRMRNREASVTIASEILDEGVDIRPLDTLILAGSGKSKTRALQRVGRTLRPYPGKKDALIIDFEDHCKHLLTHSRRRRQIYETEPEFDIKYLEMK